MLCVMIILKNFCPLLCVCVCVYVCVCTCVCVCVCVYSLSLSPCFLSNIIVCASYQIVQLQILVIAQKRAVFINISPECLETQALKTLA